MYKRQGFREIRVLLVLVAAVGTDISKVGHDARMEARQTELNVAERIVAGDITELSISGRRVFECPLIVVFRIHDVFVLLGVALTTGGVFKMRGRTVVAARSLDVVRTDVMACHAIHILMSTAC